MHTARSIRTATTYCFAITLAAHFSATAEPSGPQRVPLVEELSRSDLAQFALDAEIEERCATVSEPAKCRATASGRAAKEAFRFPQDADDGVYGVDVSHHNEDGRQPIDWNKLHSQGVFFVYAKATQGESWYDDRFARTWSEIGRLRQAGKEIYRGAYHFLSADGDASRQAGNFLTSIGTLGASDLPPCVDVEWDLSKDGLDRWGKYTEVEIVKKIERFSTIVEAATGRKPILYTNKFWWIKRMPTTTAFKQYAIWIADYGPRAFEKLKPEPRVMDAHNWLLWQFTETGAASDRALTSRLDVNIFRHKTPQEFRELFQLSITEKTP